MRVSVSSPDDNSNLETQNGEEKDKMERTGNAYGVTESDSTIVKQVIIYVLELRKFALESN